MSTFLEIQNFHCQWIRNKPATKLTKKKVHHIIFRTSVLKKSCSQMHIFNESMDVGHQLINV